MISPKISIIVPVYKVEKYIHKCIDSILNQTFKDFEVILVDDGSPDNCGKICDDYAKKDNRVVVIHKENGGQATARNAALDIARGEYIGFVDSDDYIQNDMFENLYNACTIDEADISIIGTKEVNESGKVIHEYIPNNITFSEILKRAHPWNKLFNKKLFVDSDLSFYEGKYYEDLELVPKLFVKAKKVCTVKSIGYIYLQRDGSTTSMKDKKILDMIWAYKELKLFLINEGVLEKYKDEFEKGTSYFKEFFFNILRECPTIFIIKNSKYIISGFRYFGKFSAKDGIIFFIRHLKTKFDLNNI